MLPLHLCVPREMRAQIEATADQRKMSIGAVTREFLAAGIEALEKAGGVEC